MPPDPGEPNEKITLNVYARDMALLRQRYPRGGHLTFIKRLLRAWADEARQELARLPNEGDDMTPGSWEPDESLETLKTLERKFP